MKETNNITEVTCQFGITRRVMAFFNLGENGKIDNFFIGLERKFKEAIEDNEHLLAIEKTTHKRELDSLKEAVIQAQENLDEAYLNVPVEKVATRDLAKSFQETYLKSIDTKSYSLKLAKDRVSECEKAYEKFCEDKKEQIEELKKRIAKLHEATK